MRSHRWAQLAAASWEALNSRTTLSRTTLSRTALSRTALSRTTLSRAGVALAVGLGASALWACAEDLVDDTGPEVCYSQKRWIGKLTANEEMYPGHECVGCHRQFDGPEFMAAGTVYGVLDPEGTVTTRNDCFGVEGALVTITAADGQVLQTRTNRAGNFYFEGRESSLAKPFKVNVQYELPDGTLTSQPMNTSPSYGGCAKCHTPGVRATPDAVAGAVLGPDATVEGVYPIFTGPVPPPAE